MPGPAVPKMEPSFDGQANIGQGQQVSGPVPLLQPGNGHRPEYQMSRPQPVGGQIPQQGQFEQPAAAFPRNQVHSIFLAIFS
jgi:hypothetical protein